MKIGDKFLVVNGGGPNRFRRGDVWEIIGSKHLGDQLARKLKSGITTSILNGFLVASREVSAGRLEPISSVAPEVVTKTEYACSKCGSAFSSRAECLDHIKNAHALESLA